MGISSKPICVKILRNCVRTCGIAKGLTREWISVLRNLGYDTATSNGGPLFRLAALTSTIPHAPRAPTRPAAARPSKLTPLPTLSSGCRCPPLGGRPRALKL